MTWYHTRSISWLLKTCWCKKPQYLQSRYWPIYSRIFQFQYDMNWQFIHLNIDPDPPVLQNGMKNSQFINSLWPCCIIWSQKSWLTHWGWMTYIGASKVTITGSDNGLSPGWRQAMIWTNAGILLIGPLRTNFSGISIQIHTFSFQKVHLKKSSGKWRPFCVSLNVLTLVLVMACQLSDTKTLPEPKLTYCQLDP